MTRDRHDNSPFVAMVGDIFTVFGVLVSIFEYFMNLKVYLKKLFANICIFRALEWQQKTIITA